MSSPRMGLNLEPLDCQACEVSCEVHKNQDASTFKTGTRGRLQYLARLLNWEPRIYLSLLITRVPIQSLLRMYNYFGMDHLGPLPC